MEKSYEQAATPKEYFGLRIKAILENLPMQDQEAFRDWKNNPKHNSCPVDELQNLVKLEKIASFHRHDAEKLLSIEQTFEFIGRALRA